MAGGIHHITAITAHVQRNVDFYAGFLGLRLVKRTAGFEDARQLHLFYGDGSASPGSLLTFLVWEDGARGRVGHGQVSEIALAVPRDAIGFWLTRALSFGLPIEGPSREAGEPTLRLRDPDGIVIALIGSDIESEAPWAAQGIDAGYAITRIRGATLLSEVPEQTAAFLTKHFGYRSTGVDDTAMRLVSSSGDAIDIRAAQGFWPQVAGAGTIDHIAFRAASQLEIDDTHKALAQHNSTVTTMHDRRYFSSLYVREPGNVLIELATDGPGFTIDEPQDALGTSLFMPPSVTDPISATVMLPQFSLPGEYRIRQHDLPFVHRFYTPDDPDGSTIVLLHGTGGDEADLMPLAHSVAPRATLLGVRGRSTEEGVLRWFRRLSAITFDQADIRSEAEAFAAFIEGARAAYGLDPARTLYLGYSNGANLLGAMLSLHPHLMRQAVLLRAMAVLDETPPADLSDVKALLLSGASDPYRDGAPVLEEALKAGGAALDARAINAGHGLSQEDVRITREWLSKTGFSR